jgi:hypothetical protein
VDYRLMRYSLHSLMLFVFWGASVGAVYALREPWQHVSSEEVNPPDFNRVGNGQWISPDKLHRTWEHPYDGTACVDALRDVNDAFSYEHRSILTRAKSLDARGAHFIDNQALKVYFLVQPTRESRHVILDTYRLRYPDHPSNRWRHFHRPEVWMVIVVSAVLVRRLFMFFFAARQMHAGTKEQSVV